MFEMIYHDASRWLHENVQEHHEYIIPTVPSETFHCNKDADSAKKRMRQFTLSEFLIGKDLLVRILH